MWSSKTFVLMIHISKDKYHRHGMGAVNQLQSSGSEVLSTVSVSYTNPDPHCVQFGTLFHRFNSFYVVMSC